MEGGRFRVVQSDVTHGFRDEIRSEWRLPGHEHRALALPPEVV
jgi:hypothetical protein